MRQGFTELFSNRPTPALRPLEEWRFPRGRATSEGPRRRRPVFVLAFDDESETPARPLPILGHRPERSRSDGDER
jgi:hypothetical protein